MTVKVGDTVKWASSRKPLGKVVFIFRYREQDFAVVEDSLQALKVVRIYEQLEIVK